jgi:probable lipoprotein
MKTVKRLMLGFVAVFAAVLLVACGAKSDNGTYVYKPSKTELKKILEEQGLSGSQLESIGDVINFEVSIKIKDSKGTLNIAGEVLGQKNERSYDVKINQKEKTITSKNGSDEKITYKVDGDYLTVDLSKLSSSDQGDLIILKNAKFKRTK